ncbi:MAG: SpoIID/LytB domain-containing protein [Candidatus Omnitrophota bacterium]
MKNIKLITFICIITFILNIPTAAIPAEDPADVIVRVLIIDNKDSISLSLKGKYTMYAINSDKAVLEGPYLAAQVSCAKDGLSVGSREIRAPGVKVKASKNSSIYVDGRIFRGEIDILRKDNDKLMVINHVGLDEYLYGVLYHEVSHRWPMEALKAQAIAARTFALYQARQNKLQPFDLRSDIYSQVYGGRTSEKWSTTMAVNATKGKVLAYKSNLIPAYFHATCAGYTEDASNLWKIDMPPLKGVRCDFCKHSPHYKWGKEIRLSALQDKLKEKGYKIGKVASVSALSKNKSGRVDKLEIRDDAGISVVLTGKDFRQMMGPNMVRSTKFDAGVKGNDLVLKGLGWGHGVGMCQWGAFGMAKKKKKADEILKYYYPGAEITTIDKLKK